MEPLPFIQIDDYEAFREIIPEWPDTYAAWQEKHEQATRVPGEFQVVPVRPGEFMEELLPKVGDGVLRRRFEFA